MTVTLARTIPAMVVSEDELSIDPALDLLNAFYYHVLLSRETGVQMDGQVQAKT